MRLLAYNAEISAYLQKAYHDIVSSSGGPSLGFCRQSRHVFGMICSFPDHRGKILINLCRFQYRADRSTAMLHFSALFTLLYLLNVWELKECALRTMPESYPHGLALLEALCDRRRFFQRITVPRAHGVTRHFTSANLYALCKAYDQAYALLHHEFSSIEKQAIQQDSVCLHSLAKLPEVAYGALRFPKSALVRALKRIDHGLSRHPEWKQAPCLAGLLHEDARLIRFHELCALPNRRETPWLAGCMVRLGAAAENAADEYFTAGIDLFARGYAPDCLLAQDTLAMAAKTSERIARQMNRPGSTDTSGRLHPLIWL